MNKPKTVFLLMISDSLVSLLGLIRSKMIAIIYGVTHVGILGQIITFYNFENTFVTFGTKIAIINFTGSEPEKKARIFGFSFTFLVLINFFYLIVSLLLSKQIALWLFNDPDLKYLVVFVILLAPLQSLSFLLESMMQAENRLASLTPIKIGAVFTALVLLVPMIHYYGLIGVIADLGIWFLTSIILLIGSNFRYLRFSLKIPMEDRELVYSIVKISSLNTVRYIVGALALLVVRIFIVHFLSMEEAGHFQAVWSLTNYLNIGITAFGFYLLPRLSNLTSHENTGEVVQTEFINYIAAFLPMLLLLFILPEILLQLLFSSSFVHLKGILYWMTMAKFFEAIIFFIIIVFESRQKTNLYLRVELIKSVLYIGLSYLMIRHFGLNGIIASAVLINLILSLYLIYLVKSESLFSKTSIIIKNLIIVILLSILFYYLDQPWISLPIAAGALHLLIGFGRYKSIFLNLLQPGTTTM